MHLSRKTLADETLANFPAATGGVRRHRTSPPPRPANRSMPRRQPHRVPPQPGLGARARRPASSSRRRAWAWPPPLAPPPCTSPASAAPGPSSAVAGSSRRGPAVPGRRRPSGALLRRRPPSSLPLPSPATSPSSAPARSRIQRPKVDFPEPRIFSKSSSFYSMCTCSLPRNSLYIAPFRACNILNCSPRDALQFFQLHHVH